eukprot:TRINITY_DN29925_c0_g1_i14.p1 TRINITY_DN29925_c0_g1~~TRINITY_DN29925_c0_g1_i14.p1  ORF type:complete len:275 (+),score=2.49 TRINITY_DN29925_c0_g1_i14:136-960(+)
MKHLIYTCGQKYCLPLIVVCRKWANGNVYVLPYVEKQNKRKRNKHAYIIIGGVKGTSHIKLYEESGFSSLKERRKRHRLLQFFKMINGRCPNYLTDLLPSLVSERNPYHRRRPLERIEPRSRTELYKNSFLPSTTALWNSLPDNIKASDSISQFKQYMCMPDTTVPPYYYIGNRSEQVNHCRLRLGMSNINYDLYNRHLLPDPKCACGHYRENAEHFLLHCPNYNLFRANTISILPHDQTQLHTLLHGNPNLRREENELIIKTVHQFIAQTKRL